MIAAAVQAYVTPTPISLGCPAYAKLDRADLMGRVFDEMRKQDWLFNLTSPRSGNLCRHFTRRAVCFIQDVWASSPYFEPSIPDPACFEFWFMPDASRGLPLDANGRRDGHSVALCFTDNGADFIDFMNLTDGLPTLWTLSHDEFSSRYFVH